jgi:hypothetical protein
MAPGCYCERFALAVSFVSHLTGWRLAVGAWLFLRPQGAGLASTGAQPSAAPQPENRYQRHSQRQCHWLLRLWSLGQP